MADSAKRKRKPANYKEFQVDLTDEELSDDDFNMDDDFQEPKKAKKLSRGPKTSTQKPVPQKTTTKPRLSVEEKVFQRQLEQVMEISKSGSESSQSESKEEVKTSTEKEAKEPECEGIIEIESDDDSEFDEDDDFKENDDSDEEFEVKPKKKPPKSVGPLSKTAKQKAKEGRLEPKTVPKMPAPKPELKSIPSTKEPTGSESSTIHTLRNVLAPKPASRGTTPSTKAAASSPKSSPQPTLAQKPSIKPVGTPKPSGVKTPKSIPKWTPPRAVTTGLFP